jgi:hypothetical protein
MTEIHMLCLHSFSALVHNAPSDGDHCDRVWTRVENLLKPLRDKDQSLKLRALDTPLQARTAGEGHSCFVEHARRDQLFDAAS